jgi:hypothetical protein
MSARRVAIGARSLARGPRCAAVYTDPLARAAVGVLSLLLTACTTAAASGPAETPALIVRPTAESRAELAKAVSTALGGSPVTLADDALTHDSLLVIEPARPRGPDGLLMNGRDLRKPEQFRLVRVGSHCVLVRQSTGGRQRLKSTQCVPAAQSPPR